MKAYNAYLTEILAVDPSETSGKLHRWSGPTIFANSWEEAVNYCKQNMGYLKVIGEREIEDQDIAEQFELPGSLQVPLSILSRGIIKPE